MTMKVSLRLFAGLHDLVGKRDLVMELSDGATISELKSRLAAEYPVVEPMLSTLVFAIDEEYVPHNERLRDGAHVDLIPPVSGGAVDLFRVTRERLEPDAQKLIEAVRRDESGAIAVFYGVARNHSEGRRVERLEYEAQESMAARKLNEVAQETMGRFPEVTGVGAWHRVGLLEIGEASLLVVVSSPHRGDAFEACHWTVDRIKEVVPVWKKEHWQGGAAWVEGHPVQPPETAAP
jgi:MoaE-MoaD fusion protein